MAKLEWLLLDDNRLTSLSGLEHLSSLKAVSLTYNDIGDDHWPETQAVLARLEGQTHQLFFAPQRVASVYGQVPGQPMGPDPDEAVVRDE